MNREEDHSLPEREEHLWILVVGPTVWFTHFLLSYVTAAVWCARFASGNGDLGNVRVIIFVYTLLALIAISMTGWRGYRHHRHGSATLPHDDGTPADRHRFLGFATLLLNCLSFVATIYVALAAVFIGSCR